MPASATTTPSPADALSGQTLLIAEANASETAALQTVLGNSGATVEVVTNPSQVIEEAKKHKPGVLLIDHAMPGLDLGQTTRILSRHPDTAATAILLVAPADLAARDERRLKELDVFGILKRPLTCSGIRGTFTNAINFHNEAASMRTKRAGGKGRSKLVQGCSALLKRDLSCPYHSFGVPVESFQLRAGKIETDVDLFDLPIYRQGGSAADDFVDYNLAGLSICTECYFATNDPNYFDDPDRGVSTVDERGASRAAYRIDPATRGKITQAAGHRGLVAFERTGGEPQLSFFSWNRSHKEALIGYELAIATSRVLYEAAPVRRSLELLRLGNYELRRARLHEQMHAKPTRVLKHRAAAGEWLAQAFAKCKGVAMYKAAYQLTSINIHVGQDAVAFRFLQALREQTRLSMREQEDPVTLDRYLRRAQNVWEDRSRLRAHAATALAKAA